MSRPYSSYFLAITIFLLIYLTNIEGFKMSAHHDDPKKSISSLHGSTTDVGTPLTNHENSSISHHEDWNLMKGMHWRRAVKRFQIGASADITKILESIALAPSSSGVTPYRVHSITDQELKVKLRAVSYNQPQIEESFAVLFFTAITDSNYVTERFIKARDLDTTNPGYAKMVRGLKSMSKEEFTGWARAQAYIALGVALAFAAEQKIATCPMEGFVSGEVNKLLHLGDDETAVVCLAIGVELADSALANPYPKYRLPFDDVIVHHSAIGKKL